MPDLVIRGGKVVTPAGVIDASIAIEGGQIVEVSSEVAGVAREIDASGLIVMPGLIDVHVHFNEPGRTDWEGAETGSQALAAGGGTLFFDMPLNSSPCTVGPAEFDAKRTALKNTSVTDFALWGGLIPGNVDEMSALAERGVVGYKAFLCDSGLPEFPRADDLTLYEGMRESARLGLPVAIHAENEEITKASALRLSQQNRCDIDAFLESRPVIAEVEAIHRAGLLARETGCKLHIVHISSGRGVAAALEQRTLGADITLETCPHYLFFTEDDLHRIGALAKCAPPLRNAAEQEALWNAVLQFNIDIIGSDHSPCPPSMKQCESFFQIWGGIPGIQSTLPVLVDRGYHERGLTLERIAAATSWNGARRFQIEAKGAIEPGYDADLVLMDIDALKKIGDDNLHRHRVSPYDGATLRGVVRQTMLRGEVIYSDGAITAARRGKFVRPNGNANAQFWTHA